MFESTRIYVIINPDGHGDFEITYTDQEPVGIPMCQYLKTIYRQNAEPPMKVYGMNVHIGDIDFEALDMTYWRVYQIIRNRSQW